MQAAVMAQPAPPAFAATSIHRKPIANPANVMRPSQQQFASTDTQYGHSRSRTTSSGVFPNITASPTATINSQYQNTYQGSLRRTPTSSTSSTSGTPNRSNSGALRRSSSTRSGSSPTSYVALMRKQKATVWCDRAQYEDPRILAQQRQAKMRANMEVAGGPHHAPPRSSSGGTGVVGGVRSKVGRHHGVPKASLYAPKTYTGSGVPLRLSATEVDEGSDEEDAALARGASFGAGGPPYHQRTGSGRSSLGSGRRVSYITPALRNTSTSSPTTHPHTQTSSPDSLADLHEEPTPNPASGAAPYDTNQGYFSRTATHRSSGSTSSGERHFGDVGGLRELPKPVVSEKSGAEDLVRRGSVDERSATMRMGGGRLFIANPDLSD